jgi:hypothetical protein
LHFGRKSQPNPRHGPESERAGCLVNALSTANVGETGKPMNILFDNFSLENGLQFDETFMRGLSRALVAVPFVTADALARMCEAGSETRIDHVLLEWWLALVLAKAEGTMLRFILPIFCGEVRYVGGKAGRGPWGICLMRPEGSALLCMPLSV